MKIGPQSSGTAKIHACLRLYLKYELGSAKPTFVLSVCTCCSNKLYEQVGIILGPLDY